MIYKKKYNIYYMDVRHIPISAYTYYNNTISLLKENPLNNMIVTNNKRGDIVSYKLINILNNVNIYKIIYLSFDNRSKNIVNLSATLYVPINLTDIKIVSVKHETYTVLNNSEIGYIKFANNTDDYNLEMSIALYTNNIVICADGIGFGESFGNQFYLDPLNEIYPCVDAIRAIRNLFNFKQILPIKYDDTTIDIIQLGYDIGGMFSLSIANEIITNIEEKNKFKINSIICGAPYNFYNNMEKIIKINNNSGYYNIIINKDEMIIDVKFIFYIFLYLLYRKDIAIKVIKTDAYNNILPLFENIYNTNEMFIITFAKTLRDKYKITTIPENPTINNLGIMDISLLIDIKELERYNSGNQESCDFTNRFANFHSLGNIPIVIVYSLLDELCIFKGDDGCKIFDNNINKLTGKVNIKSTKLNLNSPVDDHNKYDNDLNIIMLNIKNTQNNQYNRITINCEFDNDAFYNLAYIPIIIKLLNEK